MDKLPDMIKFRADIEQYVFDLSAPSKNPNLAIEMLWEKVNEIIDLLKEPRAG